MSQKRYLNVKCSNLILKHLFLQSSKNENVVGYSGDDRIILIQHSDPKPKVEKVHSILKQTEDEIGSGYSFEPCWKVCVPVTPVFKP